MKRVTLINCFEIPAGREDEFFALWQQVNAYMKTKPGYLSHRLYRALSSDASFRFINVAHWASVENFQAAHDEGFRQIVSQPAWAAFQHRAFVYEPVHQGGADPASLAAHP
jgi:heme-degrading monooxygenase HmoA